MLFAHAVFNIFTGVLSPPKIQEIEMNRVNRNGLQNEIIGFEMELSKYERLSVLLRSDSIKSEMG